MLLAQLAVLVDPGQEALALGWSGTSTVRRQTIIAPATLLPNILDVQPRLQYGCGVSRIDWVMLVYRLPRTPSTPRITLWRKLRRLGVAQVVDGVVALPLDSRNREQLEWLADEVVEAGGEATIWVSQTATAAQERALAAEMAGRVAAEYRAITAAAQDAVGGGDVGSGGGRWRGFAASFAGSDRGTTSRRPSATQARAAVERLAALDAWRCAR